MRCGNSQREEIRISQVFSTECFASFQCGVKQMDDFIHDGLQLSVDNHSCVLYKATINDTIVALFALAFDSLYLDSYDKEDLRASSEVSIVEDYAEVFWSKHHYPALEIAYLAISKTMQGQSIGAFIIEQIVQMASSQRLAGCMFLTVEALTGSQNAYSATGFYHKQHFTPCEYPNPAKATMRMFRPLYL